MAPAAKEQRGRVQRLETQARTAKPLALPLGAAGAAAHLLAALATVGPATARVRGALWMVEHAARPWMRVVKGTMGAQESRLTPVRQVAVEPEGRG